ncbi:MAG TPA: SurA N-terminal domain-containing protein, partial [Nitrospiria bacterium]
MLKNMREGANANPWIYKTIMFLIALAFVVTMGWGAGVGNPEGSYVAQIGDVTIDRRHYQSSKERAFRYYREILGENFKEDLVQQMVINSMVERELWLKLAGDLNLS